MTKTIISIHGVITGYLWGGGKAELQVTYTPSKGETLYDAIRRMCKNGNFEGSCTLLLDTYIKATLYKGNKTITRIFDIDCGLFPSIAEFIEFDYSGF